jgi:hypothetical protein
VIDQCLKAVPSLSGLLCSRGCPPSGRHFPRVGLRLPDAGREFNSSFRLPP